MGKQDYFSHRLYGDAKFRDLIALLAEYLSDKRWVVAGYTVGSRDEYHSLTEPPDIKIRSGNRSKKELPEASILSSPFRSVADDSGYFLFRVVHLRWGWEKELISPFQVQVARKQFELCPNYIEIETHRKWYAGQKEIANQLSALAGTKGINTYIRSYEDEFLDALDTAYGNLDEKADALHDLTRDTIPWDLVPELTTRMLPLGFVPIIPRLHPDTVRFLRTAEHLRNVVGVLPDNSPAIVEYCKSVERELHAKVFQPIIATAVKDDSNKPKGNLKKVWDVLGKPKTLTLGEMKDSIVSALHHENDQNQLAAHIRAVLFGATAENWFSSPFIAQLEHLIRNYRNAAAHKSVMEVEDVEQTRMFVLGDKERSGLLEFICEK
jgi:hypothetical protein